MQTESILRKIVKSRREECARLGLHWCGIPWHSFAAEPTCPECVREEACRMQFWHEWEQANA